MLYLVLGLQAGVDKGVLRCLCIMMSPDTLEMCERSVRCMVVGVTHNIDGGERVYGGG